MGGSAFLCLMMRGSYVLSRYPPELCLMSGPHVESEDSGALVEPPSLANVNNALNQRCEKTRGYGACQCTLARTVTREEPQAAPTRSEKGAA